MKGFAKLADPLVRSTDKVTGEAVVSLGLCQIGTNSQILVGLAVLLNFVTTAILRL